MIKDTRLNYVRAAVQLLGHLNTCNLFPIAVRRKANGSTVDFYFDAPHCTDAQMGDRWSVRQSKFVPECCVETGKPMRMRVNRRRKNDPFCLSVPPQKIDRRIGPRDPCENGHRDDRKSADQNCSMPGLENEHCDLTFSIILTLCSRAKTGRKHWNRERNKQKLSKLPQV
jgi:hypothetical protein